VYNESMTMTADGRHFENQKTPYFSNGLIDLHDIYYSDAYFPSKFYRQFIISFLKIQDGGRRIDKDRQILFVGGQNTRITNPK